jgi:hypothetical protein
MGIPNHGLESFDALLDFFGKLGYLIEVQLMRKEETLYFQYYINKAIKNDAIITYAKIYQFGLFALLIEKLNLQPKESLNELARLVKP